MAKKEKFAKTKIAARLYASVGLAVCTALPVVAVVAMTKAPRWYGD